MLGVFEHTVWLSPRIFAIVMQFSFVLLISTVLDQNFMGKSLSGGSGFRGRSLLPGRREPAM